MSVGLVYILALIILWQGFRTTLRVLYYKKLKRNEMALITSVSDNIYLLVRLFDVLELDAIKSVDISSFKKLVETSTMSINSTIEYATNYEYDINDEMKNLYNRAYNRQLELIKRYNNTVTKANSLRNKWSCLFWAFRPDKLETIDESICLLGGI